MIGSLVGRSITGPMLYAAAAVILVLLAALGVQTWRISLLEGDLGAERDRYAALSEKNGRCEGEAAGLRGAVGKQNLAVKDVKAACEAGAGAAAKAAMDEAMKKRPETQRLIDAIQAGKPQFADDLCKSACYELRRELAR